MKKVLNKITRFIYGVDCYPMNNNTEYTPTFKTMYPDNYNPSNCDQFNNWATNIHSLLKTK